VRHFSLSAHADRKKGGKKKKKKKKGEVSSLLPLSVPAEKPPPFCRREEGEKKDTPFARRIIPLMSRDEGGRSEFFPLSIDFSSPVAGEERKRKKKKREEAG